MMFVAAPAAAGVVTAERQAFYYLLGQHILAVTWDDNNSDLYSAGTVEAPALTNADYAAATIFHSWNDTSLIGASLTQGNRLGLWTSARLVIVEFVDITADVLAVASTNEILYPADDADWQVPNFIVESRGRTSWEHFGFSPSTRVDISQYWLNVLDEFGTTPLLTADAVPPDNDHFVAPVYDAMVVTPRGAE